MKLLLKEKVINPTIIEGFPGFGFVGTIATEFIIQHLKAKQIGTIISSEMKPIAILHDGKVIPPLAIFYDKKYNLIILHAMTPITNLEWKISDVINKLYKELNAKEIISIEGISGSVNTDKIRAYFHTNNKVNKKKLRDSGAIELEEGVIMGISASLILNENNNLNSTFIFAETYSNLPDSKAAARIIEILDSYLNLKIDTRPLLKAAQTFENKLKTMLNQTLSAERTQRKKKLSYLG